MMSFSSTSNGHDEKLSEQLNESPISQWDAPKCHMHHRQNKTQMSFTCREGGAVLENMYFTFF